MSERDDSATDSLVGLAFKILAGLNVVSGFVLTATDNGAYWVGYGFGAGLLLWWMGVVVELLQDIAVSLRRKVPGPKPEHAAAPKAVEPQRRSGEPTSYKLD